MSGDEKIRHCNSCDKSVFNLAQMTRREIEAVLLAQMNTGRTACIRMYKRPDGTVVTADCLSVKQKLRLSINKSSVKIAAATAAILALAGITALHSQVRAQDVFDSDQEVAYPPGRTTSKNSADKPQEYAPATTIRGVSTGGAGTVRVDNLRFVDEVFGSLVWVPLLSIAAAILGILATCASEIFETDKH